jgi:methylmalonyl-CoA mutase N-terminal domain/subunit
VGVNKFTVDNEPEPNVFPIDPSLAKGQLARLKEFKANRDHAAVDAALERVREAAHGTENILIPMKEALRAHATLGEVSDAMRDVFGMYQPGR